MPQDLLLSSNCSSSPRQRLSALRYLNNSKASSESTVGFHNVCVDGKCCWSAYHTPWSAGNMLMVGFLHVLLPKKASRLWSVCIDTTWIQQNPCISQWKKKIPEGYKSLFPKAGIYLSGWGRREVVSVPKMQDLRIWFIYQLSKEWRKERRK